MGRQVLIVDDEPNLALALRFLLEQVGFDVAIAGDADSAIATARAQPPAAVLLESHLPGGDGYSVLQRLREDPALGQPVVVMIAARSPEIERDKALAVGADDYIAKPFNAEAVVRRLQQLTDTTA